MYEFELNLHGTRIRIWNDNGPNGIKSQWGGPSHNHADHELHILLQGEVTVDVEGKAHSVRAGEAILIAPGHYHCRLPESGQMERFCLNFSVSEGPLLEALREAAAVCRVYPVTEEVLNTCRQIHRESVSGDSFSRILMQSHLIGFLMYNFRLLQLRYQPENEPDVRVENLHNHAIDLFFEENLKQDVGIDDLAAKLYLSRGQLNRLLKREYGMTFREKMIRARMGQAARLLRYTDLPVYRVAEEVGYSDASSFYHVFRRWCGSTPEQYRSEIRKQGEETEL